MGITSSQTIYGNKLATCHVTFLPGVILRRLIGGEFKYAVTEPEELAQNFMNQSIVVCFALKGNISLGNKY